MSALQVQQGPLLPNEIQMGGVAQVDRFLTPVALQRPDESPPLAVRQATRGVQDFLNGLHRSVTPPSIYVETAECWSAIASERAAWFLAAPAWTLVLLPSHDIRTALSVRATAAALLRAMAVLLAAYLAVYFYVPSRALPRLVALYILWEGALFVLAWRFMYHRGCRRDRPAGT